MSASSQLEAQEYFISGGSLTDVEIGATGLREIFQNVRMILATWRGTCVLDRNFGLRQDLIDDPMPVARAKMIGEVPEKVHFYEPRVKVMRVEVLPDPDSIDGKMVVGVRIRIRNRDDV